MQNELLVGTPVRTHDGLIGLIASFTESGEYCKVKYEENGEAKFRSFEVSKLEKLQVLPLYDEANRFIVEPYNKDFLHIVAAQFGIPRKCFGGYTYSVPAHLRSKVYPRALGVTYGTVNKVVRGGRVERITNEKNQIQGVVVKL
jgi:hypothetical protein